MKIYLRNVALTADKAAFEFTRRVFAGKPFTSTLGVCPNPACDCWEVNFNCTPNAAVTTPDWPHNSRQYFTLSLDRRAVARRRPSDLTPQAKRLAAQFVAAMTEADWEALTVFYHAAKRSQTEHVQLDQIEVRFPEAVLKDPSVLVAYVEIFPFAQYFNCKHQSANWLALDRYCANPQCDCQQALLEFLRITENANGPKVLSPDGPSLFYDYKLGAVKSGDSGDDDPTLAAEFFHALRQERRNLDQVLATRQHQLRYLYARQSGTPHDEVTPPLAVQGKVGRNDPCPCGSGKKFKKCCGATPQ